MHNNNTDYLLHKLIANILCVYVGDYYYLFLQFATTVVNRL